MNKEDLPWIEKYRPHKISDILFDNVLRDKFNRIIETKIYPNLILMGNPGVGKTSTLLAFARQVSGKYYNEAVLELNASDNRGLDIVDKMIIHFCKKIVTDKEGKQLTKFIIFDEADNITPKAQYVISDLIDQFSATTVFTFTSISWSAKKLPPSITTVYWTWQPVGTALLSYVILNEISYY